MRKAYRFKCRFTTGTQTVVAYHLVLADNKQKAREQFSARLYESRNARAKLPNLPSTEILAIDEIDDATLKERCEGADLITIPALRRLPRKSLVVIPADNPGCESGWIRRVLRDAEGHDLHDNLKVVGCRGYMESPPQGGPWYLVSSSDGKLGVLLCQEHLAENFPDVTALMKALSPANGGTKAEANGKKAAGEGRPVAKRETTRH
jgi:hypothetical protein